MAHPGRPRKLDAAPPGTYRTVALGERGRVRALRPGPLDEWVVYVEGEEHNVWSGRWLLAVLSALLDLPPGAKDDWVYDLSAELAGKPTPLGIRYPCPCCDFLTLDRPPPGTFETCPVCGWEDDNVQFEDPEYEGGANKESLLEARDNFELYGASSLGYADRVRAPRAEERP